MAQQLQIPSAIAPQRGSLAEFAAQVACFFWFESSYVLHSVADASSPILQLNVHARPTPRFRKWVSTILNTTQVSREVVTLALLFIFRLKKLNADVQGKQGSEYRLMTIALMLGNKYLDDNTYTNKTWSEVSGISVHEIHIMEVEFLQNMRYLLFTGPEEWDDWYTKLARFHAFFERTKYTQAKPHLPAIQIPQLPSPPSSNNASPPLLASHSPSIAIIPAGPVHHPMVPMPLPSPVEIPQARKRSLEGGEMPISKRITRSMVPKYQPNGTYQANGVYPQILPSNGIMLPSVPLQPVSLANGYTATSLPPPSRAMAIAYGPSGTVRGPHTPVSRSIPAVSTPTSTRTMNQSINISPFSGSRAASLSAGSPASISSQFSTFSTHSPSYFLTNRDSPYHPVRRVNTLLAPPAIHTPQTVQMESMQYHPLSKRPDYRIGIVPYDINTPNWHLRQ